MPNVDRIIIATSLDRLMAPLAKVSIYLSGFFKKKEGAFQKAGRINGHEGSSIPSFGTPKRKSNHLKQATNLLILAIDHSNSS